MRQLVQLQAVTLRGIGSYYAGARLEIKPLTVLCGTNGSGKSTWLRALRVLKGSVAAGFPFDFADDLHGTQSYNFGFVNSLLFQSDTPGELPGINDEELARQFGPIATIGLELKPRTTDFGALDDGKPFPTPETPAADFLWLGRIPPKTSLRLRLTHPKGTMKGYAELPHAVELSADFGVIRFELPVGAQAYTLSLSRSFLPATPPGEHTAFVVTTDPATVAAAKARLAQLLDSALNGFFSISAIRKPQRSGSLPDNFLKTRRRRIRSRHVGECGEFTQLLWRAFAHNMLRRVRPPLTGFFDQDYTLDEISRERAIVLVEKIAGLDPSSPRLQRVLALASDALRLRLMTVLSDPREGVHGESREARTSKTIDDALLANREEAERVGRYPKPSDAKEAEAQRRWRRSEEELTALNAENRANADLVQLVLDLLNGALSARDLYSPSLWPTLSSEARFLADRSGELEVRDLRRLNRILLDSALGNEQIATNGHYGGFIFETYYSEWLKYLVDVHVRSGPGTGDYYAIRWTSKAEMPSGFLVERTPTMPPFNEDDPADLNRFGSGPFDLGVGAAPANMSSGFHQVAPIIVQAGLMQRGELCGVENPEVHLHPGLQLRIADLFLHHVRDGKRFIVETHSDLFVRRVLRAILSEEIPQSGVGIEFVKLGSESGWSEKTSLAVDKKTGQVTNWPDGFLTDDVIESRRLIEKVYGRAEPGITGEDEPLDEGGSTPATGD